MVPPSGGAAQAPASRRFVSPQADDKSRLKGQRACTRAEFDASKIHASMLLALRKRPVSVEQIDAAMERIQEKLLNSGAKEVPSTRLGELVMRELKRIDKVAYVRFASVYRSFEDVDEFRQLIRDI